MKKTLLNNNWQFCLLNNLKKGDPRDIEYNSRCFTSLDLPHDYSITKDFNLKSLAQNEGALLDGGAAVYRKVITIDKKENINYFIHFGGILGQSLVYINKKLVAINKNYYTPIKAKISEFLNNGQNLITVFVNNPQPSSRWYSGSGIFRDVYLIEHNKTFIDLDDVVINYFSKDNSINISFPVIGDCSKIKKIELSLLKDNNLLNVFELDIKDNLVSKQIALPEIQLWSVENPNLYQIKIALTTCCFCEEVNINYGFREIKITNEGFYLNNNLMKLNGVCIHHDNGSLGAVDYKTSLRRKLALFKDMGVNAIRSTHNMASDKLVELCDEMGFLLFDEAFDTWYMGKRKHDYGRFFEQIPNLNNPNKLSYAELDLAKMIKRDRLHPSVFLYSLGNELDETHRPNEKTFAWAKKLIALKNSLDSTRECTIGQNGYCFIKAEDIANLDKFMALFPICGLNYAIKEYPDLVKRHPDWRYFLSESSSAVKSRGIYIDTKDNYSIDVCNEENRNQRTNYYLNNFPTDRVGWGHTALESQKFVLENKNMFGEFIWTGIDYLGEPTPWLNDYKNIVKSSFFGIIDLAGIPKDDYYWYRSLWNKKEPTLHIGGTMNLEDNDEPYLTKYGHQLDKNNLLFNIYSSNDLIKVWLNDNLIGEYRKDPNSLDFKVRLPYSSGVLKVKSYDNDGKVVLTKELKTITSPTKISLKQEELHNYDNLYYLIVALTNNNDEVYPYSDNLISIKYSSNASIIGTDNGSSASLDRLNWSGLKKPQIKLFNGLGVIVVKRVKKGTIKIKTTLKGYKCAKINIID